VLPNDAQAVPFWLAVRPKHAGEDEKLPSVAPGTVSDFSPAGRFGDQRIMGAVAREDEARAKARDEAVDPFHGLPIPQTLASKISSSAIERDAVALVASWRRWLPPEARFVADSPVEGNGFEPSVPGR